MRPGFTFVRLNPIDERPNRADSWVLLPEGAEGKAPQIAGYAIVGLRSDRACPALDRIQVYKDFRQLGLGREMLKDLVVHYGEIRGDDQGESSPESIKAFQAVGGQPVDRQWPLAKVAAYGDSQYYLTTRLMTDRLVEDAWRKQHLNLPPLGPSPQTTPPSSGPEREALLPES